MILINIAIFTFLSPTKGLLAAPLHDSSWASIMGQYLINGGLAHDSLPESVRYYPPLILYMTAIFSKITGVMTSTTVMILTNIFLIYGGISFASFIAKIYNKQSFAFIGYMIYLFLLVNVTELYYTAGKNAQVIAYSYWFLLFSIVLYMDYSKKGLRIGLPILATLIIGTTLIHYTTIFIIPALICLLIWQLLTKSKYSGRKRHKCYFLLIAITIVAQYLFVIILNMSDQSIIALKEGSILDYGIIELAHLLVQKLISIFHNYSISIVITILLFTILQLRQEKVWLPITIIVIIVSTTFILENAFITRITNGDYARFSYRIVPILFFGFGLTTIITLLNNF